MSFSGGPDEIYINDADLQFTSLGTGIRFVDGTFINTVTQIGTLGGVVSNGNATSNTIQLEGNSMALATQGNVSFGSLADNHTNLHVTGNIHSNGNITSETNIVAAYFHGDGSNLTAIASTLQAIVEGGNTSTNTIQLDGNSMALAAQGNVSIGSLADNSTNLHVTGNIHSTGNLTTENNVVAGDLFHGDGGMLTNVTSIDTLQTICEKGNGYDSAITVTNVLSTNVASTIVVSTNVVSTNVVSNGSGLTSTTDVADGSYGDDKNIVVVTITDGRITELTDTPIYLQDLQNVGEQANTYDSTMTVGNLVATHNVEAIQFLGNASHLVSTTNVADGSYGDSTNMVAVTVADGRITALTDTPIYLQDLQNVSEQANTYDSSVILTHAELGVRASGNVEALQFIGNAAHLVSTTNVADGSYGDDKNIVAVTVADGRITALTDTPIYLQDLQNVSEQANTYDSSVILTHAELGVRASGNVEALQFIGNAAHLVSTTNVADGSYGDDKKIVAVTVTDGRITALTDTPIYLQDLQNVSEQANTYDSTMTVGNLVATTNVEVAGNVVAAYFHGDGSNVTNVANSAANELLFSRVAGESNGMPGVTWDYDTNVLSLTGNLVVTNLQVTGNTTSVDTENFTVVDPISAFNRDSAAVTSGLLLNRSTGGNVMMAVLTSEASSAHQEHLVLGRTDNSSIENSTLEPKDSHLDVDVLGDLKATGNVFAAFLHGDGSNIAGVSFASTLQGIVEGGNTSNNTIQLEGNSMALAAQGNVSIGSLADKSTNLHVTGNVHITGNLTTETNVVAGDLFFGDGGVLTNVTSIDSLQNVVNNGNTLTTNEIHFAGTSNLISPSHAMFGINTAAAHANVHVVGNVFASNAVETNAIHMTHADAAGVVILSKATPSIAIGVDNSPGAQSVAIGDRAGASAALTVAVGALAGQTSQATKTVAIGASAGSSEQGSDSVAIGSSAGHSNQEADAVAVGAEAGRIDQGRGAVAVGYGAGQGVTNPQGEHSIAIGFQAGKGTIHEQTIILNATGSTLDSGAANSLYINPIRNDNVDQFNKMLTHNVQTSEVVTVLGINVHSSNASMELSGNIYASHLYGNGSALTGISTASTLQEIVELGNSATNTIQLEGNSMALAAQGNVSVGSLVDNHTNLHVTGNVVVTNTVSATNLAASGNVTAGDLFFGDGGALTNLSTIDTLQNVANNGNVFTSNIQFITSPTAFTTTGNIGIANSEPIPRAYVSLGDDDTTQKRMIYMSGNCVIDCMGPSMAIGQETQAQGSASLALGQSAGGMGSHTISIGAQAGSNSRNDAVAIGGFAANANSGVGSGAVAIGKSAGRDEQGARSVAIGNQAARTSQASASVSIGFNTGHTSQGSYAVALGAEAGRCQQNTQSVAVGYSAGNSNQNSRSVAVGYSAGKFAQNTAAVAIGYEAGMCQQNASAIAIGYDAGMCQQNTFAIALGRQAGESTQNAYAISVGYLAGQDFQNAGSVAVGYQAGRSGQGSASVALGQSAAINYQDSYSIAIGGDAGRDFQNTSAVAIGFDAAKTHQMSYSVAIGRGAGNHKQNTAAVAIGYLAGESNQAQEAVHIGFEAGLAASNAVSTNTGRGQVGIGYRAGKTSQGCGSIAIGKLAGALDQDTLSVAIGLEAGRCNQSSDSVAIGSYAGNNAQGSDSVAIGSSAGNSNQEAVAVAIGAEAGKNDQGRGAVAVGYGAGQGVTNPQGEHSIAIGFQAGNGTIHDKTIILNASGSTLDSSAVDSLYINPIRNDDADQFNKMLTHNVQTSEVVTVLGINVHSSNASMELSGNLYASHLYGNGSALVGISSASTLQEIVELGNSATNTIQLEGNSMALAAQGNVSIGSLVDNHTNLHVTGNVHTTGNIMTVGNVIASGLYGDATNVVYSGLTSSSQFTFPNASGKLSSVSNVAWNTSSQSGYPSEFLDISGNVVFSNGNVEMTTSDLYVFDVHLRDAHHEDGRIRFTHPGSGSEAEFRLENTQGNELSLNVIPVSALTNTVAMNVASDGNVHFTQNVLVGGNTHSNLVTDMIVFNEQSTPAASGLGIDLNNVVIRGNTATSVVTIDNTWSMQTTGYVNVNSLISRTQVVVGTNTLGSGSNLCVSGNAFMGANLTVDGCIHVMRDDYGNYSGGDIRIYQGNTAPLYYYSICNEGQDLSVKASSGTNSITGDTDTVRMRTDTAGASIRVGGSSTSNTVVHNGGSVYRVFSGPAGGGIHFTLNAVYPSDYDGGTPNGTINLGGTTNQWQNFYYSGSLVSSDRNLKQDEEDFTAAEARVAVRIKNLMKKFRYRDRVAIRGDDARLHSGVIAQDVESAFQEEGLDAHRYSLWSETAVYHDNATDTIIERYYYNVDTGEHVVNEDPPSGIAGEWTHIEHPLNYPEVSRTFAYHVNYPELLCFIIANI